MGDFERTFGAGADVVEIVEAFSRGESWPRERDQSRRGLSPEDRKRLEARRVEAVALAGTLNKLTLIGIVTVTPTVKRTGIIDVSFEIATWSVRTFSSDVTHHSVRVDDERLFDLVEKELSPGTRVYVEGELRKAAAIPSLGILATVFASVGKGDRLTVLDRPGLNAVPKKEPLDDDGDIPF